MTVRVHFVCQGNAFRSRLAEAYAKSLSVPGWEISSSGVNPNKKFADDYLSPWAKITGHQNKLDDFFSSTRMQTTAGHLRDNDIIVFMSPDVYRDAAARYDFNPHKTLVWDIKDRQDWRKKLPLGQKRKRTFTHIKSRVNQLIRDVTRGDWVDIVDEMNQPLGFRLPVTITNQKGLWHRGCHALVTTPDNHTLVQKRARHIIFAPSRIDISLGGHVDAGETPTQAMIREIKEEVGLNMPIDGLRLLEIRKWSSYHPRYKRHSNCFIYTYHAAVPERKPQMTLQKTEVAGVALLPPRQLQQLIRYHRLKNLGQLNSSYAYYARIAKLAGILPGKAKPAK